jgi:hypothetical protein
MQKPNQISFEKYTFDEQSIANHIEGWAYLPAIDILRIIGKDDAVRAETWEQFVQTQAIAPGMPGYAIVVAVVPRGTDSPHLSLLRSTQNQPFRMSFRSAASEKYKLLAPPVIVSQWRERIEQQKTEGTAHLALFRNLFNIPDMGNKEVELAIEAYKRYRRDESNLRIRSDYRFRLTHCLHCRELLDSEIHILQCKPCTAIVCPDCGSCGCNDSRFPKTPRFSI